MIRKNKSLILCAAIFLCSILCIGVSIHKAPNSAAENDAAKVIEQADNGAESGDEIIATIDEWLENGASNEKKPWGDHFETESREFKVFECAFMNEYSPILREYLTRYMETKIPSQNEAHVEESGYDIVNIIIVSLLSLIAMGMSVAFVYETSKVSKLKRKYRERATKVQEAEHSRKSFEEKNDLFVRSEFEKEQSERDLNRMKKTIAERDKLIAAMSEEIDQKNNEIQRIRSNYNAALQKQMYQKEEKESKPIAEFRDDKMPSPQKNADTGRKCNLKMVNGGVEITDGQYVLIKEYDGGNTVHVYPSELASDRSVRNAINMFFDFKGYEGTQVNTISPCVLKKTAYNYVIEKKGYAEIN